MSHQPIPHHCNKQIALQGLPQKLWQEYRLHNAENIEFLSNVIDGKNKASIDEMHQMCQKQQKNIMSQIVQIKRINLYEQVAKLTPTNMDLRTMTAEQCQQKIMDYQHQTYTLEPFEQLPCFQNESQNFNETDMMMEDEYEYEGKLEYKQTMNSQKSIRNIWDEYEQRHEYDVALMEIHL